MRNYSNQNRGITAYTRYVLILLLFFTLFSHVKAIGAYRNNSYLDPVAEQIKNRRKIVSQSIIVKTTLTKLSVKNDNFIDNLFNRNRDELRKYLEKEDALFSYLFKNASIDNIMDYFPPLNNGMIELSIILSPEREIESIEISRTSINNKKFETEFLNRFQKRFERRYLTVYQNNAKYKTLKEITFTLHFEVIKKPSIFQRFNAH